MTQLVECVSWDTHSCVEVVCESECVGPVVPSTLCSRQRCHTVYPHSSLPLTPLSPVQCTIHNLYTTINVSLHCHTPPPTVCRSAVVEMVRRCGRDGPKILMCLSCSFRLVSSSSVKVFHLFLCFFGAHGANNNHTVAYRASFSSVILHLHCPYTTYTT